MVVAVAMTLDVRLVNHVQPVLTGQFIPAFRLWIVRISNCVQIGSLHQAYVGQHRFFVDDMACDVMMLMQVGAFKTHKLAIDQETSILDLRRAKTNRLLDDLVAECDRQRIEVRRLRRPLADVFDRRFERVLRCTRVKRKRRFVRMNNIVTIAYFYGQHFLSRFAVVKEIDLHLENAITIVVVETGVSEEIPDAGIGPNEKIDVALNPAQ